MSKFRQTTILRPFFDIFERLLETQIFFFWKITPWHCKNRFWKSKGSPLWMLKKKSFNSSFYQSHVMAFGLTIPKWYNSWVLQIFLKNIWSKIFFKLFFPIFWKHIWKNIFHTEVLYHFGILRPNAITWLWLKVILRNVFSTSKGGILWICKNSFCSAQKKICKTRCPWNVSKNALISASGWNP